MNKIQVTFNYGFFFINRGHAVAQLVTALRCRPKGRGFDSRWGSMEFFIDFRPHYDPRLYSASNRNEYQEHLLGVKAAGA